MYFKMGKNFSCLTCIFVFFILILTPQYSCKNIGDQTSLNLRPIIGIFTETTSESSKYHGDMFLYSAYVKWVEGAGARVVAIRVNEPAKYYEDMFKNINGVLFPGGGVNIISSYYAKAADIFYKLAIKANNNGDYFPLWGTCLGLQLMSALTTGKNLLASRKSEDSLPLILSNSYSHSRLFGKLPQDVYEALKTEKVTANSHSWGLTVTNFTESKDLNRFYRVLSTDLDEKNREFISTMEAMKYPFYATQWHPEKNIYRWDVNQNVNHDYDAVRISQYFADFFVQESRKSHHHFPDKESEIKSLIDNYHPVFSGTDSYFSTYYFNFSKPAVDMKNTTVVLN